MRKPWALGRSATELLVAYIRSLTTIPTIAMPNFYCPNVAARISQTGAKIALYDLELDFTISDSTLSS